MKSIKWFNKRNKLIPFIIILGITLRLINYLANRSLWLDESFLAINIFDLSFQNLLSPLHQGQAAPIAFLLTEKLLCLIFGNSEFSLRLLPFISGISSIFIFNNLIKKHFDYIFCQIALFFFSISNILIFYSSETKQYSIDLFFYLFLLNIMTRKDFFRKNSNIFYLLTIGIISQFFSHPSIFLLLSFIGYSLIFESSQFSRKKWSLFVFLIISWSFIFFINYIYFYKTLANNHYLLSYWAKDFMPFPYPFKWLFFQLIEFHSKILHFIPAILSLPLFVSGIFFLYKTKKRLLFILIFPVMLTLLASAFHKYPFTGRLILFLYPSFLIPIIYGLLYILKKIRHKIIKLLIIIIFCTTPVVTGLKNLIIPQTKEEIKRSMQFIVNHQKQGDFLYVYHRARWALSCYKHIKYKYNPLNNLTPPLLIGEKHTENIQNYEKDLNKLKGKQRVWILFSSFYNKNEKKFFIKWLKENGKELKTYKTVGSEVYLYDFNGDNQK